MHSLPAILICYLLGSIPFGYILVLIFHCKDIRESGSGNIGATNVARSSPLLGVFTLLLDAGKGCVAVVIAMVIYCNWNSEYPASESGIAVHAAIGALAAVCGHIFPVWLKFKGGKGVATGLGSFALLAPKASLLAIGVFIASLIIFRFVSLSSIISVATFPVLVWLLHEYHSAPLVIALISVCSLMIVLKHHQNIQRLMAGTEPRFQLRHR
jgi:acyl phosphate:glycerol-3-phosphate acyltransferase